MAELDPRFGPAEQNCNVTREYLNELYAKADRLRHLEQYLAALQEDPDFACSIGGFDEWLSQYSNSTLTSRSDSTPSAAERSTDSRRSEPLRHHAAIF